MSSKNFWLIATVLARSLLVADLVAGEIAAPPGDQKKIVTDICVYGATPAGIAAAISGAKSGKNVLLVEPTNRIGGMITNGLSHSDFYTFEALTGTFLDFSNRVLSFYANEYGADSEQAKMSFRGVFGEPGVNLRVLREMLADYLSLTLSLLLLPALLQCQSAPNDRLIGYWEGGSVRGNSQQRVNVQFYENGSVQDQNPALYLHLKKVPAPPQSTTTRQIESVPLWQDSIYGYLYRSSLNNKKNALVFVGGRGCGADQTRYNLGKGAEHGMVIFLRRHGFIE